MFCFTKLHVSLYQSGKCDAKPVNHISRSHAYMRGG